MDKKLLTCFVTLYSSCFSNNSLQSVKVIILWNYWELLYLYNYFINTKTYKILEKRVCLTAGTLYELSFEIYTISLII